MAANNTPPAKGGTKIGRDLFGLFFIFSSVLLLLSLATYDPLDPSINHVVSGAVPVRNLAGLFGAYLSAIFVDLMGFAAYIPVFFFGVMGIKHTLDSKEWEWWRWLGFMLAACALSIAGAAFGLGLGMVSGGGLLGGVLYSFFLRYFNPIGTAFIWVFAFLLSLQLLLAISWISIFKALAIKGKVQIGKSWIEFRKKQAFLKEQRMSAQKELRLASDKNIPPATANKAESGKKKSPIKDFFSGTGSSSANLPSNAVSSKVLPLKSSVQISGPVNAAEPVGGSGNVHVNIPVLPFPDAPTGARPITISDFNEKTTLPAWEKLSLGHENPDEETLPPWLLDLEENRIGLNASPSAPPDAVKVSPVPMIAAPYSLHSVDGPQAEAPKSHNEIEEVEETAQKFSAIIDEAPQPIPPAEILGERPVRKRLSLPGLNLLHSIADSGPGTPKSELEAKGRILMNCLADFGIQGELVRITPGPVVTMFEIRPAPGVKVSRISGLSDDLALSLKAIAVRVQAPIPGTDTVGIEIPNEKRETVCLKELFSSAAFQQSESLLSMGLGKDIAGGPAVADLSRMPHLLVAGATGAGKSVCLNSILLSFLYKARPDEVKLLLIDPKRIELAIYAELPHLVHPVVTEMALAKNALDWAVAEMDRRYTDIARLGVRNVLAYNAKLEEMQKDKYGNKVELEEEYQGLETMPYLVIVIDELADLMLTAAKEVETSIVRLAQLARAAGIHLILATQRPSVDVVTGLIKANFPCRISFQVTSKHDSRTILDAVGAEHLLGKGDMLFKPSGGRFQRLHGAFVSDEDVADVVNYWKKQAPASYGVNFSEWGSDNNSETSFSRADGSSDVASDPMYAEAVDFVSQQGKASISLIQRRFRIGFNRAARFVEQMEQDGIIGPADGSKPRQVVR